MPGASGWPGRRPRQWCALLQSPRLPAAVAAVAAEPPAPAMQLSTVQLFAHTVQFFAALMSTQPQRFAPRTDQKHVCGGHHAGQRRIQQRLAAGFAQPEPRQSFLQTLRSTGRDSDISEQVTPRRTGGRWRYGGNATRSSYAAAVQAGAAPHSACRVPRAECACWATPAAADYTGWRHTCQLQAFEICGTKRPGRLVPLACGRAATAAPSRRVP